MFQWIKKKSEMNTFTDLQINRVINILDQFLTSTGLLKDKSFEVKHQHWRKLFKSHSPADLNLKAEKDKEGKESELNINTSQSESNLKRFILDV